MVKILSYRKKSYIKAPSGGKSGRTQSMLALRGRARLKKIACVIIWASEGCGKKLKVYREEVSKYKTWVLLFVSLFGSAGL